MFGECEAFAVKILLRSTAKQKITIKIGTQAPEKKSKQSKPQYLIIFIPQK